MHVDDQPQTLQGVWAGRHGPAAVDGLAGVRAARSRAAAFLQRRATRPGFLARGLMGIPAPRDAQLADQLIRERRRRTRIDGSMNEIGRAHV